MSYKNKRPPIPMKVQRAVKVESGHRCAVRGCPNDGMDLHHIDENRENNRKDNLVFLCANCHRKVHDGKIDRKALRQYKTLLQNEQPKHLPKKVATRSTSGCWTITGLVVGQFVKITATHTTSPPSTIMLKDIPNKTVHPLTTSMDIIVASSSIVFQIDDLPIGTILKAYL